MEFKDTLQLIYADAEALKQLISRLGSSGKIRNIDLELLLDKLRGMYDLILDMQMTLNHSFITDEIPVVKADKEPVTTKDTVSVSEESEKKQESIKVPGKEKTTKNVEEEDLLEKESTSKKSFMTDRFETGQPTLNENLGGKSLKEDLSSQLKLTPIKNIADSIGINERFEFINELFNRDKDTYEKTLKTLDESEDSDHAIQFLKTNFDWEWDSLPAQKVLELIYRKFMVH